MSKFCGKIGFIENVQTDTDIWTPETVEKLYYGDTIRRTHKWVNGESTNSNPTISNVISVVADDYAYHKISDIRYIEWMGTKWNVESISVNYPRLELTIGGVYNGDTTRGSST